MSSLNKSDLSKTSVSKKVQKNKIILEINPEEEYLLVADIYKQIDDLHSVPTIKFGELGIGKMR